MADEAFDFELIVLGAGSAGLGLALFMAKAKLRVLLIDKTALAVGGGGFVQSFAYHSDRGLQLESVWTSALMALGNVENISFEFGAFDVSGPGAALASALSLPLTLALLSLTALVMYREHRAGRLTRGDFPRFAAAFVLAFMVASKAERRIFSRSGATPGGAM